MIYCVFLIFIKITIFGFFPSVQGNYAPLVAKGLKTMGTVIVTGSCSTSCVVLSTMSSYRVTRRPEW